MFGFSGQRGWYHDEFGTTLSGMMRSESVNSLYRGLFRRFDDNDDKFQLAGIIRGIDEIERPYLTFLGCLTVADLAPFCSKGASLWGDGFLARFAIIASDDTLKKGIRFPKGKRTIPSGLIKALVEWHRRLGLPRVIEVINETNTP